MSACDRRADAAARARAKRPGDWCDRALDAVVVSFAVWTVAYHACVITHAPAWAAALLWAAGCAATVAPAARRAPPPEHAAALSGAAPPPDGGRWPPRLPPGLRPAVLATGALAAVAAAVLLAFTHAPFVVGWALWLVAAATGVVVGAPARPWGAGPAWLERAVVAAWVAGLAALSLILNGPDADDTYYVHLSSWVGVHGTFPVRDVLFADQRFPAIYSPPISAYEALAGTVAHLTPLSAPDVVYYLVPPAASALVVLALWRLLRGWGARPVAVALSVALVFLLLDAAQPRMFGAFIIGRIWQGKTLLLALGVPLLLAVLQERRSLVLVAAAGIAAVGLTTTAIFVVPVVAAGAVVARGRSALPAFAAASAYPLAVGAVTLALHGHQPDHYTGTDVVPATLAHFVLGTGGLALLGVTAALAGPLVLPREAGAFIAATALIVALLLAPGVPAVILHATGLGRVLWRLVWAIPLAALLGALAVAGPPWLRPVGAIALVVALVAVGHPIWRLPGGPRRAHAIAYKQPTLVLHEARRILAATRTGDVVLAPEPVSQTIAAISGAVYTVDTRDFYTYALPRPQVAPRRLLSGFAAHGLYRTDPSSVRTELARIRVDLACVPARDADARRLLRDDRYVTAVRAGSLACLRRHG